MKFVMKKLIAKASKKNAERARKRLEGTSVTINIPGELHGKKSCAEVLLVGHRLLRNSRPEDALDIAQALLAQIDDIVDIHLLKARALLDLEDLGALHRLIIPLVEAAGNNAGVSMVAARYYYLLGQASKSVVFAKKAVVSDSPNIDVLLHIELCYRYSGETEKSTQILKRCLAIIGGAGQSIEARFAHLGYSAALLRLASYATLDSDLLAELEEIYSRSKDSQLTSRAAYALAVQSAKRKDRTSEIKFLGMANDSECEVSGLVSRLPLVRDSYQQKYAAQSGVFDRSNPHWFSNFNIAAGNHTPVFVLGLPRSGTTLIEQILGGHSRVGQVGESKAFLTALKNASRKTNPMWGHEYPSYLHKLSEQSFQGMVHDYELHQSLLTDKTIYIDKELANFRYVGLMALLFPKAKFIHMDRAPMDIFLSCFRNSIAGVPETANLKAIAEYYCYMKQLVGHWRSIFQDRLLIINYQSLVHEPEKFARQAADFIGIEFEPAMLDFHQRKNIVRTLSVDQVRKKIYTSSIEGWRAYSEVLEPAREVLEKNNIPLEGVAFL